jgi:hypothetical protein
MYSLSVVQPTSDDAASRPASQLAARQHWPPGDAFRDPDRGFIGQSPRVSNVRRRQRADNLHFRHFSGKQLSLSSFQNKTIAPPDSVGRLDVFPHCPACSGEPPPTDVAVPSKLFACILGRIARLRPACASG